MKYGFVYIWFDRKHWRFYIGSHWGTEVDGYVCSSSWMKQAYKRRPEDFRRRILKRVYSDRPSLLVEEQQWLNQIKDEELGKRYYNLQKKIGRIDGRSEKSRKERIAEINRDPEFLEKKRKTMLETMAKKFPVERRRKPLYVVGSPEHKAHIAAKTSAWMNNMPPEKAVKYAEKQREATLRAWADGRRNTGKPPNQRGKKMYNNGIEQSMLFECPEGWVPGGLPRKKKIPKNEGLLERRTDSP